MSDPLHILDEAARNIYVTRFISLAGYTVLIHDWLLCLDDEKKYIWTSNRSWVKSLYLINKYLVMAILLFVNLELSGLSGITFSDQACQGWLTTHIIIATLSIQVANGLVLLRVTALWEHRKIISFVMYLTLASTTLVSVVMTAVGVARLISTVTYFPEFSFCTIALDANVSFFAIVWGVPLLLDAMIIIMTALNALDRPRNMDTRIASVLSQDGMYYFIGIGSLRLFNVLIIGIAPTSLVFCGGYFAWAMATTLMNRFLINVQKRDLIASIGDSGRVSPYGIPLSALPEDINDPYFLPTVPETVISVSRAGNRSRQSKRSALSGATSFLPSLRHA